VDITGALADSYTTHPVAAVDNGAVFRCVATNAQGSVTSGGATLTVLPGERSFIRGDANGDGKPDVADAVQVLALLLSGARTSCLDASDANDDGKIDIADAIALLGHLFGGGGDLPQPSGGCGVDPTGDDLGCESFAPCKEPPTSKRSLAMPVVVYSFAAPYFSDSSNSPSVVR
ncbi:MAG: dockerin type I repeat-containing protein, partial [Phycisphaerae bacterium]|nr:dockerin type I repeat-containing protein [Phycisphaerae bacterium]